MPSQESLDGARQVEQGRFLANVGVMQKTKCCVRKGRPHKILNLVVLCGWDLELVWFDLCTCICGPNLLSWRWNSEFLNCDDGLREDTWMNQQANDARATT